MVKKGKDVLVKTPPNEKHFYEDVFALLQKGRGKARTAINFAMVETYWKIGRRIVEQEHKGKERANYGEYLLRGLVNVK